MADMGTPEFSVKIESRPTDAGGRRKEDLATREAVAFGAGRDLSKESIENEHDRSETLRGIIHWIICALVVGAFACFVLGALIVFFHLILPACGWLAPADLSTLKTIGSSALVSAVLTHMGKQITKKM